MKARRKPSPARPRLVTAEPASAPRLPPLDSVLEADYRQSFDAVPREVDPMVRLFDGRRTIAQVLEDSGLAAADATLIVARLYAMGLLSDPRARAPAGDDAPELDEWLDPPAGRARPRPRHFGAAALGLAAALAVAAAIRAGRTHAARDTTVNTTVAPAPAQSTKPPVPVEKPAAPPEVPEVKDDYALLIQDAGNLQSRGQDRAAMALFEKALALHPDGDDALVGLARCQLDLGAAQKAAALARRASPQNAFANLILGAALQQDGQDAEARAAYARYLALAPDGAYAGELRAILRTPAP